jgi:hypothetical protein
LGGAYVAGSQIGFEPQLVQSVLSRELSFKIPALLKEQLILFFGHFVDRRVRSTVLCLPLLPNIDSLFLNAFVADECRTSSNPKRLNTIAGAIFNQIRPDAM